MKIKVENYIYIVTKANTNACYLYNIFINNVKI